MSCSHTARLLMYYVRNKLHFIIAASDNAVCFEPGATVLALAAGDLHTLQLPS